MYSFNDRNSELGLRGSGPIMNAQAESLDIDERTR
jgi:hypothetical protein